MVKLKTEDVFCVEALKDYVVINTTSVKYTIHSTMKDIERRLPDQIFQRVHRSYIINMARIETISGTNLTLEGMDGEIPIGGSYKDIIGSRINLL